MMKRARGCGLAYAALLCSGLAAAGDAPRLKITYPPRETVTRYTRIRIAGSTDPGCEVRIDGKEVKVYPTGAFVGLAPLRPGENKVEVAATGVGGRRVSLLSVACRDPIATSPREPLCIERPACRPAVDMTLQPGDELRILLKGSPGMKAVWSLGKVVRGAPLEEQPPARNGFFQGIKGIYRGSYRVREGDRVTAAPVRFALSSPEGKTATARSKGRVTLLPREVLARGGVGAEGAILSDEPGGKRVGELAPGARVNICGEAGECYRLKLSAEERFWTLKDSVKRVKGKGGWPPVDAGAPSLRAVEDGVALLLPLDGSPPYRVTRRGAPNQFRLELFGMRPSRPPVRCAGAGPVEKVEIAASNADILNVDLEMRGKGQWGHAIRRVREGLLIQLKSPPGKDLRKLTIVVDPGHGGAQPGAVSPTGIEEKEVNLAVGRELADFLRKRGARVVLTREGDATLTLGERIEKARLAGADIFVSVHHNSVAGNCDPLEKRGADLYYGAAQAEPLAARILRHISGAGARTNGCHREGFAVILPADYLAVLAECGFMSHPEDEEAMLRKGYAAAAGRAIGKGIAEFVKEAG